MLCSQMLVLLVAVCSSMLLVHVSAAAQMNELTETLQADLVRDKWYQAPDGKLKPEEDLTSLLLLLSELMAARGEETLGELEEDELGDRKRLMRRHIRFTHRARKAGCRNFFWKTFTAC